LRLFAPVVRRECAMVVAQLTYLYVLTTVLFMYNGDYLSRIAVFGALL
jgi:hypothetical protein